MSSVKDPLRPAEAVVSPWPRNELGVGGAAVFGITPEWRANFDVAVPATFADVPNEGPSAGITIVTGIISALTGIRVRNNVALTGEINITGKVLPVGAIQQKVRATYEGGIQGAILPADNLKEGQSLPAYILYP